MNTARGSIPVSCSRGVLRQLYLCSARRFGWPAEREKTMLCSKQPAMLVSGHGARDLDDTEPGIHTTARITEGEAAFGDDYQPQDTLLVVGRGASDADSEAHYGHHHGGHHHGHHHSETRHGL